MIGKEEIDNERDRHLEDLSTLALTQEEDPVSRWFTEQGVNPMDAWKVSEQVAFSGIASGVQDLHAGISEGFLIGLSIGLRLGRKYPNT